MGVIITKAAEGLKIDRGDGNPQYLSQPTITPKDGTIPTIILTSSSGTVIATIPISTLETIGGNPPAGNPPGSDISGIVDQLTALLNNPISAATAATAARQDTGNASLAAINTATGAKADTAATDDTGSWSLIALIKRLLSKLPALISGRLPVDSLMGNVTSTGNLTALNQAVVLTLNGLAGFAVKLTGTWVGTVTFEGTIDGTNWTAINVAPLSGGLRVATATANGDFEGIAAGLQQIRVKATAFTSGTIGVYMLATGDTRIRRVWSTSADNFLVKPVMTGGGNTSLTTAATGTNYTAFGSQACTQLTIVNDTGVDLVFTQGGTGVALRIFANTVYTIFGITDASQIWVRRQDTNNATVVVNARWEA